MYRVLILLCHNDSHKAFLGSVTIIYKKNIHEIQTLLMRGWARPGCIWTAACRCGDAQTVLIHDCISTMLVFGVVLVCESVACRLIKLP